MLLGLVHVLLIVPPVWGCCYSWCSGCWLHPLAAAAAITIAVAVAVTVVAVAVAVAVGAAAAAAVAVVPLSAPAALPRLPESKG